MLGEFFGFDRNDGFTSYEVNKQKFYEWIKKNKNK